MINFLLMKPVDILKKGLTQLRNLTQDRRTTLEAVLKANQPLSEADEDWLDNAGNLVDEEWVVEALDCTSDYERELAKLSEKDKSVVQKLKDLASNGEKTLESLKKLKRKRSSL